MLKIRVWIWIFGNHGVRVLCYTVIITEQQHGGTAYETDAPVRPAHRQAGRRIFHDRRPAVHTGSDTRDRGERAA